MIFKYLNFDFKYIYRNGFWVLLQQLLVSLFGFLLTFFLTRHLSVNDYGTYRYVLSVLALLSIFSLPGLDTAVTSFVSKEKRVNLKEVIIWKLKYSLVGSLALFCFSLYYLISNDSNLFNLFLIASVVGLVWDIFIVYAAYLRGLQNFKTSSIYQIISQLLIFISVSIAAIFTEDIIVVFFAFLFSTFIFRLIFFCIFYSSNIIKEKSDPELLSMGKKITYTNLLNKLIKQSDKFLIWHFFGAATTAFYSIALLLPTTAATFVGFASQIVLPKFSKKDWKIKNNKKDLLKKIFFYTLFLGVSVLFYYLLLPFVIKTFFPEYIESIGLGYIFGLYLFFTPINNIFHQVFISCNRVRLVFHYKLVGLVSYLLFFSAFVIFLGLNIFYAALATVLSLVMILIYQIYLFIQI
jgi:O-antigen/teichoic acid export membrane protein